MHILEKEFNEKLDNIKLFFNDILLKNNKVVYSTTLKSSLILMLYNLSESTIRKLIEYIHDDLASFDISTLSESLNRNFNDYKDGDKFPCFKFFLKKKKNLFSGNVDSRKIHSELKKYGINISFPKGREYLLKIKYLRNNLAHGNMTFKEATRNVTNEDLKKWILSVEQVFNIVILEVKNFLNEKRFLKDQF